MNRLLLGSSVCGALFAVALGAQTPSPPSSPRGATQPPSQAGTAGEMTIVGCLAEDKTAPGTFVLTVTPAGAGDATAARGEARPPDATRAAGAPDRDAAAARTAAAPARPAMYKISGLPADQLKPHVSHQVEFKGKVSASDAAPSGVASATAPASVPPIEFHASAIRMVSATCPAAK